MYRSQGIQYELRMSSDEGHSSGTSGSRQSQSSCDSSHEVMTELEVCKRYPGGMIAIHSSSLKDADSRVAAPSSLYDVDGCGSRPFALSASVRNVPAPSQIQAAIDTIASTGGGVVSLQPGCHRTSYPIQLRSHVALFVAAGACLEVQWGHDPMEPWRLPDGTSWPVKPPFPSYGQGRDYPGDRFEAVIFAEDATNFGIFGCSLVPEVRYRGDDASIAVAGNFCVEAGLNRESLDGSESMIDGRAALWWQKHVEKRPPFTTRGPLMEFTRCRDFAVEGLILLNSPFWTVHPIYSSNGTFRHLHILNPTDGSAPNTDGVNPDSCCNINITRCRIVTGDDCIAVKSGWDHFGRQQAQPCKTVSISNCELSSPRCAGVAIGSEMSGGVNGVKIQDCIIRMSQQGVHFKTAPERGGVVANVLIANCLFFDVTVPFRFNAFYRGHPIPNSQADSSSRTSGNYDASYNKSIVEAEFNYVTVQDSSVVPLSSTIVESRPLCNTTFQNIIFDMVKVSTRHWIKENEAWCLVNWALPQLAHHDYNLEDITSS